jgi:hypothetical protein
MAGQSIRLSAVQPVLSLGRGTLPPDPCRVQLSFLDTAGLAVASSRVEVAPQSAKHLDFDASSLSRAAGGHVTLIPAIAPVSVGRPALPPPCLYTVEVFNTATGRRSVVTPPRVQSVGNPDLLQSIGNPDLFQGIGNPNLSQGIGNPNLLQGIGNPDLRPGALEFGFAGLAVGQTARLTLVNRSGAPGSPPDPCRANLAFVDETGTTLVESHVDLPSHQSTTLELNAATLAAAGGSFRPVISGVGNPNLIGNPSLRNAVGNPDLRPGQCLASFEIIDDASGATMVHQDPLVIFGVQDTNVTTATGTAPTCPSGANSTDNGALSAIAPGGFRQVLVPARESRAKAAESDAHACCAWLQERRSASCAFGAHAI